MATRLHYIPASQHARRVRMLAYELGVTLELAMVDFAKGEQLAPSYLAHNPNAKVPTLEDDGFWLWESNAIMAYLADKHGPTALYPTDARARADVQRWLFWESAHLGPACIRLTWERVIKPAFYKQEPDPALIADGEASWKRFAPILDHQLEGREYVTGKLGIADFALASLMMYREPARFDVQPHRNLQAWIARMESRDSWKQTAP